VSEWFKRFEIPYSLTVQEVGDEITGGLIAISLRDVRTGTLVAPSDVGFGIGQLLPVLVEGLLDGSQTIAVEQPEIHLHPRLQAHLADFFIESSRSDRQWIIETHSEALILRLQRRIREGKLNASEVCVLFVEHGKAGSTISELRLDNRGQFVDEWPGGFFEESYEEVFGSAPSNNDDIPF
jgi:predicted ATPase